MFNTKLSEKANAENPTLTFSLANGITAELRRSGASNLYELSIVTTQGESIVYNKLITTDGAFIPSKAEAKDIHVLSMQELIIGTTETIEPFGVGTAAGNLNLIDGATQYFLIAERCNYGFVSTISRNGSQVTVDMINASNARHTLTCTILVVAYK